MRRLPTVLRAVLLVAAFATPARADEWDDFEQARTAYLAQDYGIAATRLEALIGGEPPALQNETLLLESRKYLGAAYLFLGRRDDAEQQFTLLLRQDASYQIDPIQFPQALVQAFDQARARVSRELEEAAERAEREERERRERELRLLLENEGRIRELEALARQETVRTENSRWLAALPFGIGQFRNGNRGLGRAFAVSQTLLFTAGAITYFGNQALRDWDPLNPPPTRLSLRGLEVLSDFLRISNYVSVSAFAGLAIAGIVEAQVRFRPVIVRTRPRALPGESESGNEASRLELELAAGPFGGSLRLSF